MIILKALMCMFILIVIPACMGLLVTDSVSEKDRSLGLILPMGYIVMLMAFELVTLPILFFIRYQNFNIVLAVYTPVMLALAGLGVFKTIKNAGGKKNIGAYLKPMLDIYKDSKNNNISNDDRKERIRKIETLIAWILAVCLLIFILIMMETHVIFDGDDAYYVVQSLITQQNRSMYVTQPYTGGAAAIDMRHAMAVFTMWISYVGTVTGVHTTILCHTILPLILLPLTLITYSEIGLRLLGEKKDMLPFFVLLLELFALFGRTSHYTSEAFLLARTWQGKSLAGNFLIPVAILALFLLYRNVDNSKGPWMALAMINATAGIFSSLAVILVCILYAIGGIWYGIYTRKIKGVVRVALCCAPGVIYMIIYLYYTYFGWR